MIHSEHFILFYSFEDHPNDHPNEPLIKASIDGSQFGFNVLQ